VATPVRVFALLGLTVARENRSDDPLVVDQETQEMLAWWREARRAFDRRDWGAAVPNLEGFLARYPDDRPGQVLLERARRLWATPPAPDWDGVLDVASK
jgi:hypothetical protein